jgi:hypothetical protein
MKSWEPLALLATCAALMAAVTVWILLRFRKSPQERERKRRLAVNQRGRIGDATITDVHDGVIYYSYTVRGVEYHTAQDVTALSEQLPEDEDRVIGPAAMKYSMTNPGNSIILCEHWSGLRTRNLRSA